MIEVKKDEKGAITSITITNSGNGFDTEKYNELIAKGKSQMEAYQIVMGIIDNPKDAEVEALEQIDKIKFYGGKFFADIYDSINEYQHWWCV